jgi:hypothetical protein
LPVSEAASIVDHGVYPSGPAEVNTSDARAPRANLELVENWEGVKLEEKR